MLDWLTAIITGTAEGPLSLGILGQQISGGLVGGVGGLVWSGQAETSFSLSVSQSFIHSFEMEQSYSSSAAVQMQASASRKWKRVVIRESV